MSVKGNCDDRTWTIEFAGSARRCSAGVLQQYNPGRRPGCGSCNSYNTLAAALDGADDEIRDLRNPFELVSETAPMWGLAYKGDGSLQYSNTLGTIIARNIQGVY